MSAHWQHFNRFFCQVGNFLHFCSKYPILRTRYRIVDQNFSGGLVCLNKGHQFKKSQLFYSYTLVLQLHKSSHEGITITGTVCCQNKNIFFDLPNIKFTKLFIVLLHTIFPFRCSAVSVKQRRTIGYCPMMTVCKQLGSGLCTYLKFTTTVQIVFTYY